MAQHSEACRCALGRTLSRHAWFRLDDGQAFYYSGATMTYDDGITFGLAGYVVSMKVMLFGHDKCRHITEDGPPLCVGCMRATTPEDIYFFCPHSDGVFPWGWRRRAIMLTQFEEQLDFVRPGFIVEGCKVVSHGFLQRECWARCVLPSASVSAQALCYW